MSNSSKGRAWLIGGTNVIILLLVVLVARSYAPDRSLSELRPSFTYPDSKFAKIQGLETHYRITGQGPTLLLLHGTASSLHTWEAWTRLLKNDFRIVSLDLPAFGLTGPNTNGIYDYAYYASFLEAFVQSQHLDSFYLAGNSLGGAIALQYTHQFPNRVRKLVLLDPSGYPKEDRPDPLAFRLARRDLTAAFLRNFTPKSLFKKSLLDVYANDKLVTPALIERYYGLYLRTGNRQAFIDRVRNAAVLNLNILPQINCPTLVQWGEEDAWIPVSHGPKFVQDLPNAELIVYPGVGHVPMEEYPEKSAQDAKTFILK
ncbi:MAG: alpha/beta hydrolase [Bacteroidota bacterium]